MERRGLRQVLKQSWGTGETVKVKHETKIQGAYEASVDD